MLYHLLLWLFSDTSLSYIPFGCSGWFLGWFTQGHMKKNTWRSSCSTVPSVEVSTFYSHLMHAWSCFWPSWVLSTPGIIRTFPLFCWHQPVSTSPPMLGIAWTCTSHAYWWSILTDCGLLKPLVNPLRNSLCLIDNNSKCITDCGALEAPCTGRLYALTTATVILKGWYI